jgi:rubrerythrin
MSYSLEEDTSLNFYVGEGLWECRKCGALNSCKIDKVCRVCGNPKGYPLRYTGMEV